ncbi:hypothetical protein KAR91_18380 [Candidatus Pacearchaeota archaeon]|nr:hypothetical protein [Candidatus Pacearchaeota archaeon]
MMQIKDIEAVVKLLNELKKVHSLLTKLQQNNTHFCELKVTAFSGEFLGCFFKTKEQTIYILEQDIKEIKEALAYFEINFEE